MKKRISLIGVISLFLVFLLVSCGSKNESEGLEYVLLENSKYALVDMGTCTDTDVVIPMKYSDCYVTSIENTAFNKAKYMKNITIPASIEFIEEDTFLGCGYLENVYFEGTLKDWCKIEFENVCSNPMIYAKNFYFLEQTGTFSVKNHKSKKLTEIIIPENSYSIGSYQFAGFDNVYSVTIPETVRTIHEDAFVGCNKLVEVFNYSNLKIEKGSDDNGSVGLNAKVIHTKEEESNIIKTSDKYVFLENLGKYYLIGYEGTKTDLKLPESINDKKYNINDYAFSRNLEIESVIIPGFIPSVGEYAFAGCISLRKLVINAGVSEIKDGAFYGCYRLVLVCNLTSGLKLTKGETNNGYVATYAKKINQYDTTHDLFEKNGFVCIYDNEASKYCIVDYVGKDKELTLPSNINEDPYYINDYAFYYRDKITSIKMTNCVSSIGEFAFANCLNLKTVTIPRTVTSISNWAFANCKNLESITLPSTITSIEDFAFTGCENLSKVYYKGSSSEWSLITKNLGNSVINENTIYYYAEKKPYKEGNYWHYNSKNKIVVWEY